MAVNILAARATFSGSAFTNIGTFFIDTSAGRCITTRVARGRFRRGCSNWRAGQLSPAPRLLGGAFGRIVRRRIPALLLNLKFQLFPIVILVQRGGGGNISTLSNLVFRVRMDRRWRARSTRAANFDLSIAEEVKIGAERTRNHTARCDVALLNPVADTIWTGR